MEICLDFRSSAERSPQERRLDQLETVLRCQQKLLGHELPNILVSIQGLAATLVADPQGVDADLAAGMLPRIADAARDADGLVRRVAAFTRLLREPEPWVRVALHDLALETGTEVRCQARSGFTLRVEEPMPEVLVPARCLRHALVELLRNAAAAGRDGQPLRVEITCRSLPDGVELEVRDDGAGILEDDPGRLFEPFESKRDPRRRSGGLGLFMAARLTAEWQGALRLASTPGQGTRAVLTIPSGLRDEGRGSFQDPPRREVR